MDPASPQVDPYADQSLMGSTDSKGVYRGDRLRQIGEKIKYYAVRVMPYVQRMVATALFYAIKIVKSFFRIALEQLRFK